MYFEIKAGSITNAQHAMRLLRGKGYKPTLSRIEKPQANDGCGYVVKVNAESDNIIKFLRQSGVNVLGVEAS